MLDREKIIKAIEICYSGKHNCTECELFYEEDCNDKLMRDALELLKEQEAVKPVKQIEQTEWTVCGNCGKHIISKWQYCPYCGKKMWW